MAFLLVEMTETETIYLLSKHPWTHPARTSLKVVRAGAPAVVVKYSAPADSLKDAAISERLAAAATATATGLPNFIIYHRSFDCTEHDHDVPAAVRRHWADGSDIRAIVMPYYPLGNINAYKWTRDLFDVYKNIIKQTCFAVLYAFERHGFRHNDLHFDNILIKPTTKTELVYDFGVRLPLLGKYAILMDYDRSAFIAEKDREAERAKLYKEIKNVLLLALTEKRAATVSFRVDDRTMAGRMYLYNIGQFESRNPPITADVYRQIASYVDQIECYAKDR